MGDDFRIFEGSEHMFHGLDDPYGYVRKEIEKGLSAQVPGTTVPSLRAHGEPKWLTIGKRLDGEPEKIAVTGYAVCFHLTIEAATPQRTHTLEATFTLAFAVFDAEARVRPWIDLHDDADAAYEDETIKTRFLAFRHEE